MDARLALGSAALCYLSTGIGGGSSGRFLAALVLSSALLSHLLIFSFLGLLLFLRSDDLCKCEINNYMRIF